MYCLDDVSADVSTPEPAGPDVSRHHRCHPRSRWLSSVDRAHGDQSPSHGPLWQQGPKCMSCGGGRHDIKPFPRPPVAAGTHQVRETQQAMRWSKSLRDTSTRTHAAAFVRPPTTPSPLRIPQFPSVRAVESAGCSIHSRREPANAKTPDGPDGSHAVTGPRNHTGGSRAASRSQRRHVTRRRHAPRTGTTSPRRWPGK